MEKAIPIRSVAYDVNLSYPEIYAVRGEKRGYAVIINNFIFSKKKYNLLGGEEDSRRLRETFEGLNFKVHLRENLSGRQIKSLLRRYSQENHSEYDCFVCVLSSHGAYDKIMGTDGEEVELPNVLQNIFNCTSLTGKPKLFFIDACRELNPHFRLEIPQSYPDYMICYSALPGTTSSMMDDEDRLKGSRFIKSMCDVFRQYGEDEHLEQLLTKLKKAVNEGSKNLQNVEITESLTKMLFFTPGKWICEACHSWNDTNVCLKCTHRAIPNSEVYSNLEENFVDLRECKLRITPGRVLWKDDILPSAKYELSDVNQYKKDMDILVQAEKSTMFFKLYLSEPVLFLLDQFLTLTPTDIDSLCGNGATFQLIPAKYPLSMVFMSELDSKWIRFSEVVEKRTKFRFKRANHSVKGKEYLHIESVDRPTYYLTMGFCGWWVRAKKHHREVTDEAAFWDIRCLKTNDGQGNILSKYMLSSKNSNNFVCVDRTNRLKGCDDNLDVSKMFMFKRV